MPDGGYPTGFLNPAKWVVPGKWFYMIGGAEMRIARSEKPAIEIGWNGEFILKKAVEGGGSIVDLLETWLVETRTIWDIGKSGVAIYLG